MSEQITSQPTTNDVQTTPARRGGRGRGAMQRNQDKFRERKGAEWQANNRKRLEEKCYAHLTSLTSELAKVEVKSVSVAKQLPTTTRGIGFLVNEIYNKAQSRQSDPITIHSLFRASLAQFELQVQQSAILCKEEETFPRPSRQDCDKFVQFKETILSRPRNFLPITSLINSYGHFTAYNSTYHPYIPLSYVRNKCMEVRVTGRIATGVGNVPLVEEVEALVEGEPKIVIVQQKVYSADVNIDIKSGFCPDPYTTTLSNLRDTVVYLARGDNPRKIREFYYQRNPIPGALWLIADNGPVLTNANTIIPENYGHSYLKQDLENVQNWLGRFKGKVNYADGVCEFTGKGLSSQITLAKLDASIVLDTLELREETYYTGDHLPEASFYLGVLSLFGEYPDVVHLDDDLEIHPPSLYGPRHHSNASHLLPVSFDTVVQAVLK